MLAQCLLAVGVFATYEQSCTHSTEDFDFFVFIELSPGCDCYIGIAVSTLVKLPILNYVRHSGIMRYDAKLGLG